MELIAEDREEQFSSAVIYNEQSCRSWNEIKHTFTPVLTEK